MIYRCPICRTRRKDHGLFLQHLEQSGHSVEQLCSCSAYKYPHRKGSALCSSIFSVTPITLPCGYTFTAVHINGEPIDFSVTPDPMAKQPEDAKTMELPGLDPAPAKRGRGRPKVDNPLSPAERAKAYRDRKAARSWRAAHMPVAMYRDPLTGQTWSGRGLMPKWLSVRVQEGVDKALYLVKK